MIAKIIFPETQVSETAGSVSLPKVDVGSNVLDAASRGVSDGLHLALNVAAMLIAFITLIAFIDKLLLVLDRLIDGTLFGGALMASGEYEGYFPGSLKTVWGRFFPAHFPDGRPETGCLRACESSRNETGAE